MSRHSRTDDVEPTPNVHGLTKKQHWISKAAIKRFASVQHEGKVRILYPKTGETDLVSPGDPVFYVLRAWSQWVEGLYGKPARNSSSENDHNQVREGLFLRVENAFQDECNQILDSGVVSDHRAVTEYLSIWWIRSVLAHQPHADVPLRIQRSRRPQARQKPTPIDRPLLEKAGYVSTQDVVVPAEDDGVRVVVVAGRDDASLDVMRWHDHTVIRFREVTWGVVRATGSMSFICPDRPQDPFVVSREPRILPLDRRTVLITGAEDQTVGDDAVGEINRVSCEHAREFIFGHPDDVARFQRDNPAS
jgi:hypothetical protein